MTLSRFIVAAIMLLVFNVRGANPPEKIFVLSSAQEVEQQVQPRLNAGWEVKHQSVALTHVDGLTGHKLVILITLTPPQKPLWEIEDEKRQAQQEADRLEKKRAAEAAAAARMAEAKRKKEEWDKAHPVEANDKR